MESRNIYTQRINNNTSLELRYSLYRGIILTSRAARKLVLVLLLLLLLLLSLSLLFSCLDSLAFTDTCIIVYRCCYYTCTLVQVSISRLMYGMCTREHGKKCAIIMKINDPTKPTIGAACLLAADPLAAGDDVNFTSHFCWNEQ